MTFISRDTKYLNDKGTTMNLEIGGNIPGNKHTLTSEDTHDCEEHQNIILNPLGELITLGQHSGYTNT